MHARRSFQVRQWWAFVLSEVRPGIALRTLVRQPRRTSEGVSAIAFGIVALLLSNGFIQWIFQEMRESAIHSQLGHIQIARPGYFEYGASDRARYVLPADAAMPEALLREPEVVVVAPRLSFAGLLSHGDTTISFIGSGVDPEREALLSQSLAIDAGHDLSGRASREALLGAGLARNLGVAPGDRVVLMVSKPTGGINAVEVTVQGIFSTASKGYDDTALRLPIDTARQLLNVSGAHSWVVLLRDTSMTDAVVKSIRRRLSSRDYEIVPWYRLADFYVKTVALFSRQIDVLRIIIGAIIALAIGNTMIMGIIERTGEIGTSMALGVRRRQVLMSFVTETVLLGVIGGIVGMAIAFGLATLISAIGIPMPPPPGMAHGYQARILLRPSMAADAFLLAVAATLVASVYPAWKASRLNIVDALRHNR